MQDAGAVVGAKLSHLRIDLCSSTKHARGGSSRKAVACVLALLAGCTVFGKAQQPTKPSGEEGRITSPPEIQFQKNKHSNALENLPAEHLV